MSGRSIHRQRRAFQKMLNQKDREMRAQLLSEWLTFLSTQTFWRKLIILFKILFCK